MTRPRLAIFSDFVEEGWPSMDLVAEMLARAMRESMSEVIDCRQITPMFAPRATRLPLIGRWGAARKVDLAMNRLRGYPKYVAARVKDFDAFHVADHSYAALVHALPPQRTGVFCHDLDAFRSILDPRGHPRPRWFRAMTAHILRGMQHAAVLFYSTDEIARQIRRYGLIDPVRLVQAPFGVADEFRACDRENEPIDQSIRRATNHTPFILHVGSCIKRKRIDILLDVFAELRRRDPQIRLIKVGGEWTEAQRVQQKRLDVDQAIEHFRGIDRATLAWIYRRAAAVLVTSESEGFGLPVIEALACAAPVVASDIPVLREVGGDAVIYCAVGDVGAWSAAVTRIIADPTRAPTRAALLDRAAGYSWTNHARIIGQTYLKLVKGG